MFLRESLQHVVDELTTAGLNATGDPRDLNLPGAWVEPVSVQFDTLAADSAEVTLRVHIVVPDNGPMESLESLGGLLMIPRRIGYQMTNINTEGISLQNHGADPLPAVSFDMAIQATEIE